MNYAYMKNNFFYFFFICITLSCVCTEDDWTIHLPETPVIKDIFNYTYEYDDFYEKTNEYKYGTVALGFEQNYTEITKDAWSFWRNDNFFVVSGFNKVTELNEVTIYHKNGNVYSITDAYNNHVYKNSDDVLKDYYYPFLIERLFDDAIVSRYVFRDTFYDFIVMINPDGTLSSEFFVSERDKARWWDWVLKISYDDNKIYLIGKEGYIQVLGFSDEKFSLESETAYKNIQLKNMLHPVTAFVNEEKMVELYNFKTGQHKVLGRQVFPGGLARFNGLMFKTENGQEYIINQKNNRIICLPNEDYDDLKIIDNGYYYFHKDRERDETTLVICIFNKTQDELVQYRINGSAMWTSAIVNIRENKAYITYGQIAYIIDLNNGEVIYSAFIKKEIGWNADTMVLIYPFVDAYDVIFARINTWK